MKFMKFQYLLNDEQKVLYYFLLFKKRFNKIQNGISIQIWNAICLFRIKIFRFLFFKKNKNFQQMNQIIQAPKQIDSKNIQKYCPKCKRIPQIPSILKTTGYIYYLECLQQMVIKNEITNKIIIIIIQLTPFMIQMVLLFSQQNLVFLILYQFHSISRYDNTYLIKMIINYKLAQPNLLINLSFIKKQIDYLQLKQNSYQASLKKELTNLSVSQNEPQDFIIQVYSSNLIGLMQQDVSKILILFEPR
ncbi:unnamed protein product [Paramecium sonneborni]|uniref:Transmembrane protein n=1 Tax=Paramecium sonneborni TaxID=65129 RepID=A0A8S1RVQ7_9CILI|nr:unnamed protein product [Paramecium sonneborni]